MKNYLATFTALAEVTIVVSVTAENQTEGIVAAHDLVKDAEFALKHARITGLVPDSAKNVGFERTPVGAACEAAAPPAESQYVVETFEGADESSAPLAIFSSGLLRMDLATALRMAEGATSGDLAMAGYAHVKGPSGEVVEARKASRGLWEVTTRPKDQSSALPALRISWLTKEAAQAAAIAEVLKSPHCEVTLWDYIDRKEGPKRWRVLA